MIAKVNVKFGDSSYQFEVEEKDQMDTLHKIIVLGNPPRKCNECGESEKLSLDTNKDKEGNTYINAVCGNCRAKAKLGRYKTGGFFWHDYQQWQNTKTNPDKEIDINDVPWEK